MPNDRTEINGDKFPYLRRSGRCSVLRQLLFDFLMITLARLKTTFSLFQTEQVALASSSKVLATMKPSQSADVIPDMSDDSESKALFYITQAYKHEIPTH